MTRLTSIVLALLLLITTAALTTAYDVPNDENNWFTNSEITDYNLTICFRAGTPVFTNRATIANGYREWSQVFAPNLTFTSIGDDMGPNCNIRAEWQNLACGTLAVTGPHNAAHTQVTISFNAQHDSACSGGNFYWSQTLPVPNGRLDIYTIAAHEAGHALGLGHSFDGTLMEASNNCQQGKRVNKISWDDRHGLVFRYGGLNPSGTGFVTPMSCFN